MKWGPVIAVLLLLISVLSFLLYIQIRDLNLEDFEPTPLVNDNERALVTYVGQGWNENSLNSSEIMFDVTLYNYGYSEAKNVEVTCELYPGNVDGEYLSETPILSVTQNTGNVASTSYKDVQIYVTNNDQVDDYSLSVCEISSCENCEILDKRLT